MRDVLHSDDLIDLYRRAYLHSELVKGQIFNIGGGTENSLSILELFDLLSSTLCMPELSYQKIPRRMSDQNCFIASTKKAQDVLGWSPKIMCKPGINRMLEWCKGS